MSTGPTSARLTHIALPCADLDASLRWYEEFTPLVLVTRREDSAGQTAWLSHDHQAENPFIVVLAMFFASRGKEQPQLGPFAHLGIELPSRQAVVEIAERGQAAQCLTWAPEQYPDPIGFICALSDPDGNVIEYSFGQGIYEKVQELWGS